MSDMDVLPKHELDVREMLRGDLVRLRYVDRYSTCRVNHRETVAEHSYFVTMYSVLIGQWYEFWHGNPLNWRKLMAKACIHDVEESRTGDWPRTFKHSDPNLGIELDRVAGIAIEQLCSRLVQGQWQKQLAMTWQQSKDSSPEGRVVAFADFLSVLSYVIQEIESGNANAVEHIRNLQEYFSGFEAETYQFLRPLVTQTASILKEIERVETRH